MAEGTPLPERIPILRHHPAVVAQQAATVALLAGEAGSSSASAPVSWGRDPAEATARAHEQFRWFAGGWKVCAAHP